MIATGFFWLNKFVKQLEISCPSCTAFANKVQGPVSSGLCSTCMPHGSHLRLGQPHPLSGLLFTCRKPLACQLRTLHCRWATGLTFSVPDTLNQLLGSFSMGRTQLTDSPFAFVDLSGRALTKTGISSYFHSMLSTMDPSFPTIPPSLLRQIFVDERRSRQRVEGPDDAAAAQVMGNSTQA